MKFRVEFTEKELMALELLSERKLKSYTTENNYSKEEFSTETRAFVCTVSEDFTIELYMLIMKMLPAIKQFAKAVASMVKAIVELSKEFIRDTENQFNPFLEKWKIGKKYNKKPCSSNEEADFVYYLEKYENIVDISSKEATESTIKELEYLFSKLSEEEKSFYRKPFLKTLYKLERIKRRFY